MDVGAKIVVMGLLLCRLVLLWGALTSISLFGLCMVLPLNIFWIRPILVRWVAKCACGRCSILLAGLLLVMCFRLSMTMCLDNSSVLSRLRAIIM